MAQFLDSVLSKLLDFRFIRSSKTCNSKLNQAQAKIQCFLSKEEILLLCQKTIQVLKQEESLLTLQAPITVVGDIHGQFYDLIRIFENNGYPGHKKYLFLGDYVDRGKQSLEVFCLLMCLKVLCPHKIFLLRGNHESRYMNKSYGFYEECKQKFNGDDTVWNSITSVFDYLPFTALINDQIFCCHGGLSPEIDTLERLRNIKRPLEIPKHGLACDLVWSDPSSKEKEMQSLYDEHNDKVGFVQNSRLAGYNFNESITDMFMQKFDIMLIIRGHEVVENGYEFSFHDKKVITLFSAPNYLSTRGNKGAIMNIDEDLVCKFTLFNPVNWEKRQYINDK